MKNISDVMNGLSPEDVDVLMESCDITENVPVDKKKTNEMRDKVSVSIGRAVKPKWKPFPLRYRIGVVAAMLCVAIIVTAVIHPTKRMQPGRIYDVWDAPQVVNLDETSGTLSKTAYFSEGRTLSININYLPVAEMLSSVVGSGADRDLCIDMIGYYFYSAVSFDYRTHYLLFEKDAVDYYLSEESLYSGNKWVYDEEAGKYTQKKGMWTYGDFIKELSKIPDMIGIRSAEVSFAVNEVYGYRGDDLEPLIEQFHHEAGLDEVMDYDKITEVRIYKISDLKYVYNGRAEFGNLDEFFNTLYFYRYDNVWYILPNMAQVDSTVDIFSNIRTVGGRGYVTEVGEDFFTIGGTDFVGERKDDIKVGDYVSATGTGVSGFNFFKLKSYEILAEK